MIKITPYSRYDGIPTFRDSDIMNLFYRMKDEGSFEWAFYEETDKTAEQWLMDIKTSCCLYVAHDQDRTPRGIVWLNGIHHKRARIHFCGFKAIWAKKTIRVGQALTDYIMNTKNSDGEFCLDCLWGVIPSRNKPAVAFAKKIGWQLAGEIDNYIWNAKKERSEKGAIFSYSRRD